MPNLTYNKTNCIRQKLNSILFLFVCYLFTMLSLPLMANANISTSTKSIVIASSRKLVSSKSIKYKKKIHQKPKITLKQKLSLLKIVLKNTNSSKLKKISKAQNSDSKGVMTLVMLIWGGILATAMAFFTSYVALGIIFAVLTFVVLVLSLMSGFKEQNAKDTLWLVAQILNLVLLIASIFD